MNQLINFFAVFVIGLGVGWYMGQTYPLNQTSYDRRTSASAGQEKHSSSSDSTQWDSSQFRYQLDDTQVAKTLAILEDPNLSANARSQAERQLKSHMQQLLDSQRWSELRTWAPALAEYFYDDPVILLTLAELDWHEGKFNDALIHYFAAHDAQPDWRDQQKILATISRQLQRRLASDQPSIQAINSPNTGLSLLTTALEKQPQYPPFALMMAENLAASGDWNNALYQLELLPYSDQFQGAIDAKIAQLSASLAQLELQEQGIPLTRRGDQYLVNVRFSDSLTLPLLIDTGASITALAPQTLAQIPGLRDTGKRTRVSTANGAVVSPVYQVDSMAIGDWALDNVELLQVPLDSSSSFAGLLGMNFLRQFVFSIDQNQSQLWLQPR